MPPRHYARAIALLLGLAFFALTALSIWVFRWSNGLPVFWPAPGLLLAFMAASPRRNHGLAVFAAGVGGFSAMVVFGWSLQIALAMTLLTLVEEVVSFKVLRALRSGKIDWFDNLDGLVAFFLVAGLCAPALFALPASLLGGPGATSSLGTTWLAWLGADGLGAIIVTPLAYLFFSGSIRRDLVAKSTRDHLLMLAAVFTVAITGAVVFLQEIGPLLFLPFFPLMIAAFKAERLGALLSVLSLALIGMYAKWSGSGPMTVFMGDGPWSLQVLQLYVATALLTALPAGVELKRRRRAKRTVLMAMRKLTESEKTAQLAANTDALTGLSNRRGFMAALNDACLARRAVTLAILDLDGFKSINDRWGHLIGDQLLKRAAERFSKAVGGSGVLARLGGDEFAYLADNDTDTDPVGIAEMLTRALGRPILIGGHEFSVTSSCGVVRMLPGEAESTSQLLTRADVAMFHAKRDENAQWKVFSTEMEEDENRKAIILEKLATARGRKEVELVYQPIFDLVTKDIVSIEALARWDCPGIGPIAPTQFIPLAERSRLIRPLTWHLFNVALSDCVALPEHVSLSFNVSARQFSDERFADGVMRAIERNGFAPARLKLEVTETSLLCSSEIAAQNCKLLQDHGIRIVLDDFGAGYASVSYLRTMRFDEIKLDGSLTIDARTPDGYVLAKGVLELCKTLEVPCTAEHLEGQLDVERFRKLGCTFGQGFHLARPQSAQEISGVLHDQSLRGHAGRAA